MGVKDHFLLSSTAIGRVLTYVFENSLRVFEAKEYHLTGRVLKRHDHPYIH